MTGQKLKKIRLKLDMSQTEFALKIGVMQSAISMWESEERKIPPYIKNQIAILILLENK